jgi:ribonuclease HI
MTPIWLYTDGASRGNPGPAAAGYLITNEAGEVLAEHAECIGKATNNMAEYRALILGLRAAARFGTGYVTWISDSELVTRQIQGKYRVKKSHLKGLFDEARQAMNEFAHVIIEHHPRKHLLIGRVDAKVNKTLDECAAQKQTSDGRASGIADIG